MELIIVALLAILVVFQIIILTKIPKPNAAALSLEPMLAVLNRMELSLKQDFAQNREEFTRQAKENREELAKALSVFKLELNTASDRQAAGFNELLKTKLDALEKRQEEMIRATESKLDLMRETVDEKLSKTLNERLAKSFETVDKQLESVREGLGEMKNLAQDVGGLKKVLSNVKMRGGLGEVQLEMLLEQILAPSQFEANVRSKKGSQDVVEFVIKLPGRDEQQGEVLLPIDAKFPKDAYEQLVDAYESGDTAAIEAMNKNLENTIKKMAKDISEKYIDPPYTTDFAIMFLPFEGIYAEVIRRSHLIEQLQREYKVIVTGPTTLAAILNSLQMGFRTLALQKRSSEVWTILGQVKSEFEKFGGLLDKAKKNIEAAGNNIDDLIGTRTNAIERRLRGIEAGGGTGG